MIAGEINCEWNIIYIEDHETFTQIVYDFSGKNNTKTIGIAIYHYKLIYISEEKQHKTDWWGMTVLEHEVLHAYLFEKWVAGGREGKCPCEFHP